MQVKIYKYGTKTLKVGLNSVIPILIVGLLILWLVRPQNPKFLENIIILLGFSCTMLVIIWIGCLVADIRSEIRVDEVGIQHKLF